MLNQRKPQVDVGRVQLVLPTSLRGVAGDYVSFSAGTEPASVRPRAVGPYYPGALLPRGPWRRPNADELRTIDESKEGLPGNTVWLIDLGELGDELIAAIRALGYHGAWSMEEAEALNRTSGVQTILERFAAAFEPFQLASERTLTRVVVGPPGVEGLTALRDGPWRHLGLHVDSWDNLPVAERLYARNRVTVNVGAQDRYFLFLDRTLQAIWQEEGSADLLEELSASPVARRWMERRPDHPVMRLRLKPGQAYIAPTENLIHDASSEGQSGLDLSVAMRGYFGIQG